MDCSGNLTQTPRKWRTLYFTKCITDGGRRKMIVTSKWRTRVFFITRKHVVIGPSTNYDLIRDEVQKLSEQVCSLFWTKQFVWQTNVMINRMLLAVAKVFYKVTMLMSLKSTSSQPIMPITLLFWARDLWLTSYHRAMHVIMLGAHSYLVFLPRPHRGPQYLFQITVR